MNQKLFPEMLKQQNTIKNRSWVQQEHPWLDDDVFSHTSTVFAYK